jgi:hypothetical protein
MVKDVHSVAEALGRAHAALREDLAALDGSISATGSRNLAQVHARLVAAEVDVDQHFRFEEVNGYMDTVRKREPRLEHTVQQLADEHRQLRVGLRFLVERAGSAGTLDDGLRTEVAAWIERLERHEARENELVQNAFNLDIGAED